MLIMDNYVRAVKIMENLKYWVWLASKRTMNAYKIMLLLEHFDNIQEIYDADVYDGIDDINLKEKRDLLDKSLFHAEEIIEKMDIIGGRIVTFDDAEYPEALKSIIPPPYVLYMKGKKLDWKKMLAISVVGSRKCTEYGRVVTQKLCHEMALAGITIVSGMARGIDSIAAVSALKMGGTTVAILGCGLDIVYPPENEELMEAIAENGLLITEYPPSTPPYGHNFPERNRIISGLSRGLLVVEAAERSGTATSVARARDYGKDIFAVPGGIFHAESEGTNDMIKKGAIVTTSVRDIFERYPVEAAQIERASGKTVIIKAPQYAKKKREQRTLNTSVENMKSVQKIPMIMVDDDRYKGLNENEKRVVSLLLTRSMHIDELVRESGFGISLLNPILTVLEMMGHIKKLPGNNYKLDI